MANMRGYGAGIGWKGASHALEALKAWSVSRGSADRDLLYDRPTLIDRSRALYQNSAFAGAAVETKTTNVVGSGLRLRPNLNRELLGMTKQESEAWEKRTRSLFELWAGSKFCDAERKNSFYQLQELALKTQLITGDCFALSVFQPSKASPFFTSIKLLEGTRCQNPMGTPDSDYCTAGVEVDRLGSPVAYHFTKKPIFSLDQYTDIVETVKVPAFGAKTGRSQVIHLFTSDRPDQRRGVPWLSSIILLLKQEERYQDAELMAAVVSAMFCVFITTDAESSNPAFGNVQNDQRVEGISPKGAMEITPGAVMELAAGEDVKFANPARPNTSYGPFVDAIFTEAAARLGIGKGLILKKFDSSYSAARAEFMESYKTFKKARANLAGDFCQPVYEAWLTEAVMTGRVSAPGFFEDPLKRLLYSQCQWIGDAPGMLDPLKETQAYKMQVDEQFKDRTTATTEMTGGDYYTVSENIASEQAKRRELGIPEPGVINKNESFTVSTSNVEETSL